MNAEVKFPFRLCSTPFCRFCVQRHFRFVAYAFNPLFCCVAVLLRLHSISWCLPFVLQLFVMFALEGSKYSCMTYSGSSFLLQQNGTFSSVNMFMLLALIVCCSCFCPFLVDLLYVFRLSSKRSLFVRCTFNTSLALVFALAFALNKNGKGTF